MRENHVKTVIVSWRKGSTISGKNKLPKEKVITKTRLYKYIVNFTAENTKILRWKIVIFFLFLLKT